MPRNFGCKALQPQGGDTQTIITVDANSFVWNVKPRYIGHL